MAQNRYTSNFRLREDLIDTITPKALQKLDNDRSLGIYRPAAWLPVQFIKTNYKAGADAFVISAFKVVSLDTSPNFDGSKGRIVPAGLRSSMAGTGSYAGTVLTYTADDVTYGVMNLVTGERVSAAVSYTGEQVCDALIERGLVRDDDAIAAGATVPVAADADVTIVIELFISHPVGIVLQDVYVWGGLPEENDQFKTNYTKQAGITFLTRAMLKVPHRVAGEETSDTFDAATLDGGGSTTYTAGAFIDDGEYWEAAEFTQLNRYSAVSSTAPVIALGLAERVVAKNTDRTPFACDVEGVLVRERNSIALVAKEGDCILMQM